MIVKTIADALNLLRKADPKDVTEVALELAKAGKEAQGLSEGEMITDFRSEGQTNQSATKEEIKVGPTEEASGAGAEKMIDHYSPNQARQHGITLTAEKLDKMFAPMASSMKALADGQKALVDLLTAKAEPKEDEEEKDEVEKANVARAKSLIAKAKTKIVAAKAKDEEEDDAEDEMKARKARREAKALKKSAGRLLGKARTFAYAASSAALKAEIRTIAAKADVEVFNDDDDDEDEKEASKSEVHPDPARNQADKPEEESSNDGGAEKARTDADLKKAIESSGIPMLTARIDELMAFVSGKASPAPQIFDLAKAKPEFVVAKSAGIDAAVSGNLLTLQEADEVRSLLNMYRNAQDGNLEMAFVKARMAMASAATQSYLGAVA